MKCIHSVLCVLAIVISTTCVRMDAQTGSTIPEAVAGGGSWVFPTAPSGVLPDSMSSVLRRTDAIVSGIVGQPGPSYLSEDQRDVYTDYSLQSPTVHYQDVLEASPVPGAKPSVTVTVRGGAITVNGAPFTAEYKRQPRLVPGTEYLFLLRKTGATYRLADDYCGLFATADRRFTPVFESSIFAVEYREMSAQAATEKIVALKHALRAERKK